MLQANLHGSSAPDAAGSEQHQRWSSQPPSQPGLLPSSPTLTSTQRPCPSHAAASASSQHPSSASPHPPPPSSSQGGMAGTKPSRGQQRPLVVGVVGEPNVGKSSTMNALLGAHRVAVSSHPGRTKHYQTHFMAPGLMLCDCPGLVFPRVDVSLPMQILYGSFPIARCRDPYAVVAYLAAHMWPRLHLVLGLTKVDGDGKPVAAPMPCSQQEDEPWSVLELCEALAAKKSWRSTRGGRLDTYRAANFILRAALGGRNGVCLSFLPPELDAWHVDIETTSESAAPLVQGAALRLS
ncbi:P-loop containing nucleoside triphosphate hydrolase protein [Haematococcus lacustris]